MIYRIRHTTSFRYAHPVSFARCNLRLEPIDWPGQRLESFKLAVTPEPSRTSVHPTGYAARLERIVADRPARELVIESRSRIAVDRARPEPEADDPGIAEVAALALRSTDLSPAGPANYLYPSPLIPHVAEIAAWCALDLAPDRGVVEAGLALARRIKAEFRYDGAATRFDTPAAEAFAKRHGVCQDFAQIMISGARAAGLPAAYVSGYLRTLPPPGKPRLVGADATHAWAMIWCGPVRGWIGFDPTNACLMAGDHIVAAVGRDYADVAPIDGIFLGRDGQEIDVEVDVEPVERVTP